MTDILISIHPRHAINIIAGTKKFEFRKKVPVLEPRRVWLYATQPVSSVAGFFDVKNFLCGTPDRIWEQCASGAGITEQEFRDYFKGREFAAAYAVGKFYARPYVTLDQLIGRKNPPRSWCYVREDFK